jgi:response regulator RpfG family c-di-GMP phosphodiesterase
VGEKAERATVLIVDDERGPRESLRMILAPNHRVLQASSGVEALEILGTNHIDLVTLDLNMPGIKGEELMRTIRGEYPQVEIIIITGCGSLESAAEGIRSGICDYLLKPFDVVQVSASVLRALSRQRARVRLVSFLEELGGVVGRDRDAHVILDDVQRSQKLKGRLGGLLHDRGRVDAEAAFLDPPHTIDFLEVLAETIETKDRFMRGHARRVAFYVGVPTDLLLREGALEKTEREVVEQHPEIGSRLLKPLDIPSSVATAIRHHHEWWDGTGYPDGLSGEEIPLLGRIIGITDAFDTMSCDRPYRAALDRSVIRGELRRFSGVQFDPDLTKEFLRILDTGICDVDPEFVADAIAETQEPRAGATAS